MHKYLVILAVLLPLLGVYQMERGAYGNSIGMHGYPNGATLAYAAYAFILLAAYFLTQRGRAKQPIKRTQPKNNFRQFGTTVLVFLAVALFLMLFGFGALKVWLGVIGKGEFRANLGPFGAVAYLLINSIIPMLVAFATALYINGARSNYEKAVLGTIYFATFIVGSTWGFKGTGISMLIPSLIILLWNASIWRLSKVFFIAAGAVVVLFYTFDAGSDEALIGASFLWTRATVLQGDVSWHLYGQYVEGVAFPSYSKTLLPFMGDTIFAQLSGITRENVELWAEYHFDILIGLLVGLPLSVVEEGHSIVGTPFSDGLVMGGIWGVLFIALFGGTFAGWLSKKLKQAIAMGNPYRIAFIATYFGMTVLGWLRNGATLQLVHIAILAGLFIALGACAAFDTITARRRPKTRPCKAELSTA